MREGKCLIEQTIHFLRLVVTQLTTVSKPLFSLLSTTYKTLETAKVRGNTVEVGNLAGDFTGEIVGKWSLLRPVTQSTLTVTYPATPVQLMVDERVGLFSVSEMYIRAGAASS
jgi:hypothetical protein